MVGDADRRDVAFDVSHSCSSVNFSMVRPLGERLAFVGGGTKGRSATVTGSHLPRTSAKTACRARRGRRQRSPWRPGLRRVGPKPPEVTSPIGVAALGIGIELACRRASAPCLRAAGRRGGAAAPFASSRRMRVGAGKAAARAPPVRRAFWIAHSSAASTGWSWCRCRGRRGRAGFQPQRIARAEADRLRPSGRRAARWRQLLGLVGGHRDLEAVLAGIARARDDAGDTVQIDSRGTSMKRIAATSGQSSRQDRFGARPLQREQARGRRTSTSQASPDAACRWAMSASLQAALTTRNR